MVVIWPSNFAEVTKNIHCFTFSLAQYHCLLQFFLSALPLQIIMVSALAIICGKAFYALTILLKEISLATPDSVNFKLLSLSQFLQPQEIKFHFV